MRLTIVILLLCMRASAAVLPVLPLPWQVTEGTEALELSVHWQLDGEGLPADSLVQLQWHWDRFVQQDQLKNTGHEQRVLQLVLLGKQKKRDRSLLAAAGIKPAVLGSQGYLLILQQDQYVLAANTGTGLFYGLQTLRQLVRAGWNKAVTIVDRPSFEYRAVYDDISRGPVSTVAFVKQQIERLAELKINYLSFYIEHVVQPVSYPDFAPADGKFTISDIRELSAYAARFHMQLIGSFQSFGHFEKILALPQYRSMGETATLISPLDTAARRFLSSVIGELCDAFSAPFFNVNCDETFDLDKGRSKAYIDRIGAAKFYADHIRFLYDVVKQHHKQLMMWGDIALQHEHILDQLPRDIIYLTWEYGDQASYDHWIQPFQQRGLSFMVCPGILNSYRLFPDMKMATANVEGFTKAGHAAGSMGVYTTVWDDGGACLFAGDWYGIYKAADRSWNVSAAAGSFNDRFATTAYGSNGTAYVQALDALMTLRRVPLTYNLTDQVWYQQLLPDSGKALILGNAGAATALATIKHAQHILQQAAVDRHSTDVAALQLGLDQYELVLHGRLLVPQLAAAYQQADPLALRAMLDSLAGLREQITCLEDRFRQQWLQENQLYSLDLALQPYEDKIRTLWQLERHLLQALTAMYNGQPLPAPTAMQLAVIATNNTYFQNWLLAGPFKMEADELPDFLYAGDDSSTTLPKPGDLFQYQSGNFRWHKYASDGGGVIDLAAYFNSGNHTAGYAYCYVRADSAIRIPAYVSCTGGALLYCNGRQVAAIPPGDPMQQQETRLELSLQPGTNPLLLKLPAGALKDWAFSFRLDPQVEVTHSKYKYYLNPETGNHDAE